MCVCVCAVSYTCIFCSLFVRPSPTLSISLSRPLIYIFIHRPFAIPVPLISISFAYFYLCTSRCAVYLPCSSGRAHTFCMHCTPLSTPPLSLKICAIYSSSVAYEKQFLHSCTLWQAKEAREASAENQPKSCSLYVNCRWFPACLPGCLPQFDGFGDTDIFGRILIKHFETQNARNRRNSIYTTRQRRHTARRIKEQHSSNSNKRNNSNNRRKTAIIIINQLQKADRQR